MIMGHRSVRTMQLPEVLNMREERLFAQELEAHLKESRPQIVLDCSRVQRFDKNVVRLLLYVLELALKRKGDVKLAAVSPAGDTVLEATGASRLFDVFASVEEAVQSFHQLPAFHLLGHPAAAELQPVSEIVA